jgi:hypothetical protein
VGTRWDEVTHRLPGTACSFTASDTYISTPSIWVEQTPFTLDDGAARTLYHPENGTIPANAVFVARDVLGRWWPHRRTIRLRLRRWRMQRPGKSGSGK